MNDLKNQIRVSIVLGLISLCAGAISHLALTDIYHGEVDVSLEWNFLRLSALLFLAFTGMALFTLRSALKRIS